jgi:hypothetical protein
MFKPPFVLPAEPMKPEIVGFAVNRANIACTGFVGVCSVYKYFSGFGFILLSGIYLARPQTSNANR